MRPDLDNRSGGLARFGAVEAMAIDKKLPHEVLVALHKLVPAKGSIDVGLEGECFRLSRGPDGEVVETRVTNRPPERVPYLRLVPRLPDTEEEALGYVAFEDKKPITDNPFPINSDQSDKRRLLWEKGWWAAKSKSDGSDR